MRGGGGSLYLKGGMVGIKFGHVTEQNRPLSMFSAVFSFQFTLLNSRNATHLDALRKITLNSYFAELDKVTIFIFNIIIELRFEKTIRDTVFCF